MYAESNDIDSGHLYILLNVQIFKNTTNKHPVDLLIHIINDDNPQ